MNKDAVLKLIKKSLRAEFETNSKAAAALGIPESTLCRGLKGDLANIPTVLLERVGVELAEPNYVKVKK